MRWFLCNLGVIPLDPISRWRGFGNLKAFLCVVSLLCQLHQVSDSVAGMTTITIHKRTSVHEDMIRLGEISEIKGDEHHLKQKLESVVIGRSPLPSKSRFIDEGYIKVRLKQNSIDLSRVKIECPKSVEVLRDYLKVRKDEIRQIVIDYINREIPWDRGSFRIKTVDVPSDLILPKGDIVYEVAPLKYWNFVGRTSFPVIFKVEQMFRKKVWVAVEVEVYTDVVVSSKPLGRYRIVSKEDVHLEKRNLANLSRKAVVRLEDVIGKRTKRRIDLNFVMTEDLLDLPPVVKRGDFVTLLVETDVLRVTVLGEVRKNGIKGDVIRVVNIASGKEVRGRVLGPNTVKVEF